MAQGPAMARAWIGGNPRRAEMNVQIEGHPLLSLSLNEGLGSEWCASGS